MSNVKPKLMGTHPYFVRPIAVVHPSRKLNKSLIVTDPPKNTAPIYLVIHICTNNRQYIPLLRYSKTMFCKPKQWDYYTSLLKIGSGGHISKNKYIRHIIVTAYKIIIDNDYSSDKYDGQSFLDQLDAKLGYKPSVLQKAAKNQCAIMRYCNYYPWHFKDAILKYRGNLTSSQIVAQAKKLQIGPRKLKQMILAGQKLPKFKKLCSLTRYCNSSSGDFKQKVDKWKKAQSIKTDYIAFFKRNNISAAVAKKMIENGSKLKKPVRPNALTKYYISKDNEFNELVTKYCLKQKKPASQILGICKRKGISPTVLKRMIKQGQPLSELPKNGNIITKYCKDNSTQFHKRAAKWAKKYGQRLPTLIKRGIPPKEVKRIIIEMENFPYRYKICYLMKHCDDISIPFKNKIKKWKPGCTSEAIKKAIAMGISPNKLKTLIQNNKPLVASFK